MRVQEFHLYNTSGQGIVLSYFVNGVNRTHTLNAGEDYEFEADSLSPETRNAIQNGYLVYFSGSAILSVGGVKAALPIVFRRNYYPTVRYDPGDLILFNGSLWLCQESVYGGTPVSSPGSWTGFVTDLGAGNHQFDTDNPHATTAAQVGAIALTEKGASNGVAPLVGGKVPAANLPDAAVPNADTKLAAGTSNEVSAAAIRSHLDSRANPHGITPDQIGAVSTSSVGLPSGVAPLGNDGLVPAAFLPASAGGTGFPATYAVTTKTQRDALIPSLGSGDLVAVLQATSPVVTARVYRWDGSSFDDITDTAKWVFHVNGLTGPSVVLTTDDILETNGKYYFTDVRLGNSTAFTAVQTKAHVQNSDTKLASGTGNEVTAAGLKAHLSSTSNPHSVTAAQIGAISAVADDPAPTLADALDAATHRIVNLGAPSASTDAATKGYIDAIAIAAIGGGVLSVNGRSGIVALDGYDVGLDDILDPALSGADPWYGKAAAAAQAQNGIQAYSGSTAALDFASPKLHVVTINASDVTISFTNLGAGRRVSVLLTNTGVSSRTLTWPIGANWTGESVLTIAAGAKILLTIASSGTTDAATILTAGGGASFRTPAGVLAMEMVDGTGTTGAAKVSVRPSGSAENAAISVTGSGTNIDLDISAKGTGSVNIPRLSSVALTVTSVLNAAGGTLTGMNLSNPIVSGFIYTGSGSKAVALGTNTSGPHVNYVGINAANTTNPPSVEAQGTDTNVDLIVRGKGTGIVRIPDGEIVVASHTYGSDWASDYTAPSKADLYAKIETLGGGGVYAFFATGPETLTNETLVSVECSGGPVSLTLPAVAGATAVPIRIQRTLGGTGAPALVYPASGEAIEDYPAGFVQLDPGDSIAIVSDGTVWKVLHNLAKIVRTTGDQTIQDVKTFSSTPIVPADPYASGWATDLGTPTKQDVYDKIESLGVGAVTDGDYGDIVVSSSGTVWSLDSTISSAIAAKALDSAVVKLTGTQTIGGVKTFTSNPVVPKISWDNGYDTSGIGHVNHDTIIVWAGTDKWYFNSSAMTPASDNALDIGSSLVRVKATWSVSVNTTQILDPNNNELIKFTATSSAVNEITVANAATGSGPTISATGGDTNIDVTVQGKGTGAALLPKAAVTASKIALHLDAYVQLTTSRALTDADNGKVLYSASGSDITVTAPDSLTKPFSCGLKQEDAGAIIVATSGTAVLRNIDSHTKTGGQWAAASIDYRSGNDVVLYGRTA